MKRRMNEREKQLYYIEHKGLPQIFYVGGEQFIRKLLASGGQLFIDLLMAMNKEDDHGKRTAYTCPYHADDFRVRLFLHPEQHTTLIQLQMPKPQSMLLCRHIYLALNTETGEKFFYTIERSQSGTFLLCGWQENGGHVIFNGDVEASPELDQKEILELFSRNTEIQREMELVKASMKKNR